MGVFSWPVWEKEVSRFPWSYDSIEECYILEGDVTVEPKAGKPVSFGKGDFVTFPRVCLAPGTLRALSGNTIILSNNGGASV
jgi:uncharacterized cupin superfamily protein